MQGLKNSWNIFLDIPQTSDEDAVEAGPARQSFSSQGYDQYCNQHFLKILWFDQLDKYWTIEHDVIHALDFKLRHKISGQIQTSEVNTMHRDMAERAVPDSEPVPVQRGDGAFISSGFSPE